MIQFIHTADIHFGMENYGRVDPQTGIHSRLLDFDRALNSCIDVAIEKKVDFFLFCGDAYKTAHPTQTQQRLLIQCFFRLYDAKIPVIIIVGNHDHPLSFGKANALELFGEFPLDGFHVISKPKTVQLKTKHGPINIVGMPWPTRNSVALKQHEAASTNITEYISKAACRIIADHAEKLDQSIPAVLAGHLTVSSGVFSGSEKRAVYGTDPLFMPSQLAIAPFDYVALGHLHRNQNLNKKNPIPIVYSGSIERVDFGERKEPKGFCLVSIPKKGAAIYEFIETPTRPFLQIEVKLTSSAPQTQQMLDAIKQHSIKDAVLKILYHIPENQKDLVDLKVIQDACKSAMYIVGIIPIRPITERTRRIGSNQASLSMETLLSNFFSEKKDVADKTKLLVSKAMELLEEKEE
jgi:DNA repair protein SbcD/Mre11